MKHCKLFSALVLSAVLLASCGTAGTSGTDTTLPADTSAPGTPVTEAVTEPAAPTVKLPEKDYGGEDFVILNGNVATWMMINVVSAEEENGDSLNDAIYRRNRATEEAFNVRIVEDQEGEAKTLASKSIIAGDNSYDLILLTKMHALDLVLQNQVMDYADIPYIDMEAPWWIQNAMAGMTIAHRVFLGISMFDTSHYDSARAVFFNKNLISEYELENPYELVEEGKWTLDKLHEMGMAVAKDLDGDGKWTDADQYGYSTWSSVGGETLATGCGHPLSVSKDADDMPVFDLNSEAGIECLTKITQMIFQEDGFLDPGANISNNGGVEYFKAGKVLFYNEAMGNAQKLRQMTLDFGILPGPKWNEEQESYHNVGGNPYFMLVPVTAQDIERTGIIMESLAYESLDTVKVAAYDEMLEGKVSRDNDSEAMLNLIYSTLQYNHPIALETLNDQLTDQYMFRNRPEYASYFKKMEPRIQRAIDKVVTTYKENIT